MSKTATSHNIVKEKIEAICSLSHLHAAEELASHPVQAGVGGGPDDALGPPSRGPGQQPQQRVGDDVAGDAPVHSHVSLDVCGAHSGVNLDIKTVSDCVMDRPVSHN